MAKHEEVDDDYRTRASHSKKQKEMRGRFKLPEGETSFRILKTPGDKERDSPTAFIEYQVHRDVGPKKRFIRCGNAPGEDGNCWLCRRKEKLERKGKTEQASRLEPQQQFAVQVAVLDKDTNEMMGPLLWEMSQGKTAKSLSYKVQSVIASKKRDYLDPKKGYNLTMSRSGTGKNDTVYGDIEKDEDPSSVPKGILKRLQPFVDVMPQYDEDYAKAAYFGREDEEGEDDDMPTKKNKKKLNKRRHDEDEDEDEDVETTDDDEEEDEDEDEEEEDRPKKKKKSKKSDDDDDDDSDSDDDEDEESDEDDSDDEDEDSDDDDDDDRPKKKSKKSKKSDDDDDDDDDSDSDDEDEDSDSDSDDDDEDDTPKKKKKKSKSDDDDDDDSDSDDDEEEDEDSDSDEDEDEESDSDDDDDDEAPKKKKKGKKGAKKPRRNKKQAGKNKKKKKSRRG